MIVVALKRHILSGNYPAISFGKWFIRFGEVTYAKYSKHRFWMTIKEHTNEK